MFENRFKPIYVDLEDGQWYITNQTSDSNLKALRVVVAQASDSWYIEHFRRTTKLFIQILDNSNSEIIPESIDILDAGAIQINFYKPTSGTVNLIFKESDFYNMLPTPTVTPTMTLTPTMTVTPTPTNTPTSTVTPTVTPTNTVTATVTPTNTVTATVTPTVTPTNTVTATVTSTPGNTITPTPTVTPTNTVTATVTPTVTPTNTVTATVTPTVTPSAASSSTLGDGLIAWWSLDDAANGTRVDSHTNGYDLTDTYSGVGQGTGKISFGSQTGGEDSNELTITKASGPLLYPTDIDFTIAGWVYYTGTVAPAAGTGIISCWDFSNGYGFYNDAGGLLKWSVAGTPLVTIAPVISTWYHFVCYHDATNDVIGVIINDGTPYTTAHAGGINAGASFLNLKINNMFVGAYSHDGVIDEVGVWGRLLTGSEVTELYNGGSGIGYPL